MGHSPSVTRNIRRTYSFRCSHSSGDRAGMNEKSPRSPFNGPSRVSDGIVPRGRTRGGPAIKLRSINPKYDVATIRTNHKGWKKILLCVIEITGACIVHSQTQDLRQDSPYQSTTKLNPQIQQFWLYITRCILEYLLFCALITCYISEMPQTSPTSQSGASDSPNSLGILFQ